MPLANTPRVNAVSGQVVDAALIVHSALGPGLLESAYAACLKFELSSRDLMCNARWPFPSCTATHVSMSATVSTFW